MRRDTVGKLLGLAGIAGVAATGVVLARDERQRRAYTPEDVRSRLHERAAAAAVEPVEPAAEEPPAGSLIAKLRARRGSRGLIPPPAAARSPRP